MDRCKTCRWWGTASREWEHHTDGFSGRFRNAHIETPLVGHKQRANADPEVHLCGSPSLRAFIRPCGKTEASVVDGSEYSAELITAEDFGCVNWDGLP